MAAVSATGKVPSSPELVPAASMKQSCPSRMSKAVLPSSSEAAKEVEKRARRKVKTSAIFMITVVCQGGKVICFLTTASCGIERRILTEQPRSFAHWRRNAASSWWQRTFLARVRSASCRSRFNDTFEYEQCTKYTDICEEQFVLFGDACFPTRTRVTPSVEMRIALGKREDSAFFHNLAKTAVQSGKRNSHNPAKRLVGSFRSLWSSLRQQQQLLHQAFLLSSSVPLVP